VRAKRYASEGTTIAVRILFFNTNSADYVSDGLFHGLRSLLGSDCVDVPRHDSMYSPMNPDIAARLRGHGFTMYGLLEDSAELVGLRYFWEARVEEFDLAVVANVWTQWPLLWSLARMKIRVAVIDGSDSPRVFPYSRSFLKTPFAFATPISDCLYFKRELFDDSAAALGLERFVPPSLSRHMRPPEDLLPISCSIPEDKVRPLGHPKTKLLARHIVDPEVAAAVGAPGTTYAFSEEKAYYDDIATSKFGVTVKRAGWDALRHYEVTAAGAVPCFRDLALKPPRCAPLGLNDENCVIYSEAAGLPARLEAMGDPEYGRLAAGAHAWARAHTTRAVAQRFLDAVSSAPTARRAAS
jgi:hypothetical protein